MKVKKEYLILAVLIVTLSLYVYFRQQDRTHYELPVLAEVPAAEITKIEITKGHDTILALVREDGGWVISPQGHPADAGKVTVMLESLRNLTLSALISESKSYERYGLGNDEKVSVKAWTEEGLQRDLDVGKEAPSLQHTFVRIGGDERVFHAQGNLKMRFDQTPEDLRDKGVLAFDPADVLTVELHDSKRSLRLTRKQDPNEKGAARSSWESPEGPVDEAGVTGLLTALSNLKCRAFIYDQAKEDFEDPVYTVTLEGLEKHSLMLFAKGEKNPEDRPALSSQNESPFLLPERQADQIMVPFERILMP
jgi:hypothetical protein